MRVIGLDLSLTATGVAIWADGATSLLTVESRCADMARLDAVYCETTELCQGADLVIIEGLAFASHTPSALERAGLWWMIARWLWRRNIPMQTVAPTQVKKYCTGSGRGEKNVILREVWKRWQVDAANDNESDAYVLLRIGLVLAGIAEPETQPQREVIAALLTGGKKNRTKNTKALGLNPGLVQNEGDLNAQRKHNMPGA